jgi:prepilin signal peptidase PulO-like enzyme (type II secretory pathway)
MLLYLVAIAVLGLLIGSFCNALIWRIHEKKSIARGRSMCPDCKHELGPLDLVPVLSWLLLGAKCRYCHKPISAQYPAVELLVAALFAVIYHSLVPVTTLDWVHIVFWLVMAAGLVVLAVYDLRWMLLPDVVLLPMIVVAAMWCIIAAAATHSWSPIIGSGLAALAAGGSFYMLAAVSKGRWMGGGDIKLVFLMGLLLGPASTGVALVVGFYSAAIVSLALIGLHIKKRTDHIPSAHS